MASLTIPDIGEDLHERLRERASSRGVSTEEEARDILMRSVANPRPVRRKPSIDELTKLGAKPAEPFDLKALSDEMWDESLR